jgi:hypothetical protein
MDNLRVWNEWSDGEPEPHMAGCIEAEYIDGHGELAYAPVYLFHYIDERGSVWGHSTGSYRSGNYKSYHPKYYRWRFTGPSVPMKASQGRSIVVWSFYEAPGELRSLSAHGGDEDWVALVPGGMEQPSWMESGGSFGCCSVSEHLLEDGRVVYIGAHA